MNDETQDRLRAIAAASVAMQYMLAFDGNGWRTLPTELQDAVNALAKSCGDIAPLIDVALDAA